MSDEAIAMFKLMSYIRFIWFNLGDNKITHVFMPSADKFNKALLCNLAVKLSCVDQICILDADCVVEPELFGGLAQRLSQPETTGMIFSPYLECLNIDGDFKQVFCSTHSFGALGVINRQTLPQGVSVLYERNVGGVLMMKRIDYIDAGGMDASFKGWGGEDNEFFIVLVL